HHAGFSIPIRGPADADLPHPTVIVGQRPPRSEADGNARERLELHGSNPAHRFGYEEWHPPGGVYPAAPGARDGAPARLALGRADSLSAHIDDELGRYSGPFALSPGNRARSANAATPGNHGHWRPDGQYALHEARHSGWLS